MRLEEGVYENLITKRLKSDIEKDKQEKKK